MFSHSACLSCIYFVQFKLLCKMYARYNLWTLSMSSWMQIDFCVECNNAHNNVYNVVAWCITTCIMWLHDEFSWRTDLGKSDVDSNVFQHFVMRFLRVDSMSRKYGYRYFNKFPLQGIKRILIRILRPLVDDIPLLLGLGRTCGN